MARNITIRVSEETARWARRKAAEEDTSISRLVGAMLERQMRQGDRYWDAFELWKRLKPGQSKTGAARRWSRQEVHERAR